MLMLTESSVTSSFLPSSGRMHLTLIFLLCLDYVCICNQLWPSAYPLAVRSEYLNTWPTAPAALVYNLYVDTLFKFGLVDSSVCLPIPSWPSPALRLSLRLHNTERKIPLVDVHCSRNRHHTKTTKHAGHNGERPCQLQYYQSQRDFSE